MDFDKTKFFDLIKILNNNGKLLEKIFLLKNFFLKEKFFLMKSKSSKVWQQSV